MTLPPPTVARRRFLALAGASVLVGQGARAAEGGPIPFRINSENLAGHIQTRIVTRFAETLAARTQGRLQVSHSFGDQAIRDRDMVRAMAQGKLEMAVPGNWQLDRFDPNMGILSLPAFYGQDSRAYRALRESPVGQELNRRLERALPVVVAGRWIDLGFTNIYGIRRTIASHQDLRGLRIRVAGGEVNLHRLTAMGAQPRVIAWPDLPDAMAEGRIEGILTSHETVASLHLWDQGVTSVFEDRQSFGQYVPVVAAGLWSAMAADLRREITACWNELVDQARGDATLAQDAARRALIANGVTVTTASPQSLAAERARLMEVQPAMVAAMGMDADLVKAAVETLPRG
jgi:C4-dicarboxylate-binding protein DctP